jgi:competence ComEA-like helix-hairpin-helix protein
MPREDGSGGGPISQQGNHGKVSGGEEASMATVATKVNVNTATREELVDVAGLRPDLADAIVKFRGKQGPITSADELEEVSGVGPATLEQLRKSLDFREKSGNGSDQSEKADSGNGKAAHETERAFRETAQRTAEVTTSAVRSATEVGRGAAEAGAETASRVARSGLQLVQRTAGAMTEAQRETARQSAEGTAELGRLWLELLGDQTRHNLAIATALSKAVDWEEVARTQSEYMSASLERMNQLNSRYLEIIRTVMAASVSIIQDQDKRAA